MLGWVKQKNQRRTNKSPMIILFYCGVERQRLQQVKGGSHYPVNDACVIKYWVLPDAKKQVGSKLPTLRSKEKSRKRGNEK